MSHLPRLWVHPKLYLAVPLRKRMCTIWWRRGSRSFRIIRPTILRTGAWFLNTSLSSLSLRPDITSYCVHCTLERSNMRRWLKMWMRSSFQSRVSRLKGTYCTRSISSSLSFPKTVRTIKSLMGNRFWKRRSWNRRLEQEYSSLIEKTR